ALLDDSLHVNAVAQLGQGPCGCAGLAVVLLVDTLLHATGEYLHRLGDAQQDSEDEVHPPRAEDGGEQEKKHNAHQKTHQHQRDQLLIALPLQLEGLPQLAALLLAGGALGGLFCLLVFLLADVLSHVLQDRTCSEKERNARKVRSLTRVSTLLALAVSDRGLLGSAVLIQQVGGLLLGGAV